MASETTRSLDEDSPISRSLDLTSDIFNDLATLAEWETGGKNEERIEVYKQSSLAKKSRHYPSIDLSKLPK